MQSLRVLKIDLKMFTLLNDRFMKFSTKILEVLHITDQEQQQGSSEEFKIDSLKNLIAAQSHLVELNLQSGGTKIKKMFDTPLNVISQLKNFWISTCYDDAKFNNVQQDHLCDMLFAHEKTIEKLNIVIGLDPEQTSKMKHLMMVTQHLMPLLKRKIKVTWISSWHVDNRLISHEYMDELIKMKRPNLAPQHVEFKVSRNYPFKPKQFFDFITKMYPNLKGLSFPEDNFYLYVSSNDAIEKLDRLVHLESLKLSLCEFNNLPPVNIPSLKQLTLHISNIYHIYRDGYWSAVECENVKKFIKFHKAIEDLDLYLEVTVQLDDEINETYIDLLEIVEHAVIELEILRKFRVYLVVNTDEMVEVRSTKSLYEDWSEQSVFLAGVIEKYAKCGFVLECGHYMNETLKRLAKTDDGRVVCE